MQLKPAAIEAKIALEDRLLAGQGQLTGQEQLTAEAIGWAKRPAAGRAGAADKARSTSLRGAADVLCTDRWT